MNQPAIIFCNCEYEGSLPDTVKQPVLDALTKSSIDFNFVCDLCGLAAQKDQWFSGLEHDQNYTIIACAPRALKWLFHLAGSKIPVNTAVLNMHEMNSDAILQSLNIEKPCCSNTQNHTDCQPHADDNWIPWFPIIDYDRCTNCKQCLNFCLFNVYELDDTNKVSVSHPASCKTNCPACARVCPEQAIIFPKHQSPHINGSLIQQEESKQNANLNNLLQGDLQDILRKRNAGAKGNFPTIQDITLAQEERKKCGCESDPPLQIGLMSNINKQKNLK